MCGFCTERTVFDLLEEEIKNSPGPSDDGLKAEFYLQEAEDPAKALTHIAQDIAPNKNVPLQLVDSETLLCKALELLICGSFESPKYQSLLSLNRYRHALGDASSAERRRNFENFAKELGVSRLGLLYKQETFTTSEGAKRLQVIAPLKEDTLELLRFYIRWWLKGEGLEKNDLSQKLEEKGILDPIEDVKSEEKSDFQTIFRALWFSMNFLGQFPASRKIFKEIVTNNPAGIPFFDAHDLWLQRRAALLLYDNAGLAPFLEKGCRSSLLYYLDLKRGFSTKELQEIKNASVRLSGTPFHDDYFDLQGWLSLSMG